MKFQVDFSEKKSVFSISENYKTIEPDFGEVIEVEKVLDPYDGPYTIDPKITEIKMETMGKYMMSDVTIKPISRYDVQNTSGGNTVYIANFIKGD